MTERGEHSWIYILVALAISSIIVLIVLANTPGNFVYDSQPHEDADKKVCKSISGDGDATAIGPLHHCVYNCTRDSCVDHSWYYVKEQP